MLLFSQLANRYLYTHLVNAYITSCWIVVGGDKNETHDILSFIGYISDLVVVLLVFIRLNMMFHSNEQNPSITIPFNRNTATIPSYAIIPTVTHLAHGDGLGT